MCIPPLDVCWGGMAMINHFHGVQKHMLDAKAFGCFRHQQSLRQRLLICVAFQMNA